MIEVEVKDEQIHKLFSKIKERIQNMQPIMAEIGELIVSSVIENFEKEGRYGEVGSWRGGNKKWATLSPVTEALRLKKGHWPGKILTERGRLRSSIGYHASQNSVTVGTNLVYAAIHQFGGKAGLGRKVNIPARPFLVIQAEDLEEIKEIILDYLTG